MCGSMGKLLTPEERMQYLQIPPNPCERELGTYFFSSVPIGVDLGFDRPCIGDS